MRKKTAVLTWVVLILAIVSTIGTVLGMLLPAIEASNRPPAPDPGREADG